MLLANAQNKCVYIYIYIYTYAHIYPIGLHIECVFWIRTKICIHKHFYKMHHHTSQACLKWPEKHFWLLTCIFFQPSWLDMYGDMYFSQTGLTCIADNSRSNSSRTRRWWSRKSHHISTPSNSGWNSAILPARCTLNVHTNNSTSIFKYRKSS